MNTTWPCKDPRGSSTGGNSWIDSLSGGCPLSPVPCCYLFTAVMLLLLTLCISSAIYLSSSHVNRSWSYLLIWSNLPVTYKSWIMQTVVRWELGDGENQMKKVGLKSSKSHLPAGGNWHSAPYITFKITPFVPLDILIRPDLKLPVNQRPNKRPPTVFAVNLLSPFWALDWGS